MKKSAKYYKIANSLLLATLFIVSSIPVVQLRPLIAWHILSSLGALLLVMRFLKGIHPVFKPLLILMVLYNAAGWVFRFYSTVYWYDEVSHFFTPAFITGVLGALLIKIQYNRTAGHIPFFFWILVAIGMAISAVWEIAEFVYFEMLLSNQMTLVDTISDLALDLTGAIVASVLLLKTDTKELIQEENEIRQLPFVALFDSATVMVRSLTNVLHGRDFKGMNAIPDFLSPFLHVFTWIPRSLRSKLFMYIGRLDALPVDFIPSVNIHLVTSILCSNIPQRRYPAVLIGSPDGALIHACAAMGIPYLPQTLPLILRKPEIDPDDISADMKWAKPRAEQILTLNPDIHISQMLDPVHDRIMSQVLCYFRIKMIHLVESYRNWMSNHLEPGATILISDCRKQWKTVKINDLYTFQLGGAGDLSDDEYWNGSARLESFLKEHNSVRTTFNAPEPDSVSPEAEWGYDARLTGDIVSFAREKGFKTGIISYGEPQDMSAFVADLHKKWFRLLGVPADTLFVESFMYMEPYMALKARLIPYWMYFNTVESATKLHSYLQASSSGKKEKPYKNTFLSLFSNGIRTPGFVPVEHWENSVSSASENTILLGVEKNNYPEDFASNLNYYYVLKKNIHADSHLPESMQSTFFLEQLRRGSGTYTYEWNQIL